MEKQRKEYEKLLKFVGTGENCIVGEGRYTFFNIFFIKLKINRVKKTSSFSQIKLNCKSSSIV